ncbi:MAG TPA: hypothetical protein VKV35_11500 [Streptosporangiaceae bacterium]|nr:hypothetical protein [Streptosporangiaceae bacterium]
MMRSAQCEAAPRSDRSSASSEARNSAASIARRSLLHTWRRAPVPDGERPRCGGSALIRARMNAW